MRGRRPSDEMDPEIGGTKQASCPTCPSLPQEQQHNLTGISKTVKARTGLWSPRKRCLPFSIAHMANSQSLRGSVALRLSSEASYLSAELSTFGMFLPSADILRRLSGNQINVNPD